MEDLPLHGVRVVEMSHMVMGPTCGMVLSQLGADVIKVEPPRGDKTRDLKGMGIGFFPLFSRGKRSLVLELDTPEGAEAMTRLLGTADVFIENFRDDTIRKLSLDAATLSARFPELVVCSHKGFLSGPYAHRPALDEVVQMMTGLAYMTGSRERPLRTGASVNDIMGGLFGVIGILTALLRRDQTRRGGEVRVGLFENSLFIVAQHLVQFQLTGEPVTPMSQRQHAWPIYDIFDTLDGERLFVAVTTEGSWTTFCTTFGLQTLLDEPRLQTTQDRIDARHWTIPLIAARLREETAGDLGELLDRLHIPFASINAPEAMLKDPHVLRPGGLADARAADGRAFMVPTLPFEFDGHAFAQPMSVRSIGADTDDILLELGYSSNEVDNLQNQALRETQP